MPVTVRIRYSPSMLAYTGYLDPSGTKPRPRAPKPFMQASPQTTNRFEACNLLFWFGSLPGILSHNAEI